MSKKNCNCEWCKKNISTEEAAKKRMDFIYDVFEIVFVENSKNNPNPLKSVDASLRDFKNKLPDFYNQDHSGVTSLLELIFNITFQQFYGIEGLTPWDVNLIVVRIRECIFKGFEFMKADIDIPETPVLLGAVTAEMVVNRTLKNIDFPKEIKEIYLKYENTQESNLKSFINNVNTQNTNNTLH